MSGKVSLFKTVIPLFNIDTLYTYKTLVVLLDCLLDCLRPCVDTIIQGVSRPVMKVNNLDTLEFNFNIIQFSLIKFILFYFLLFDFVDCFLDME